jgi:hypothetical protein
MALLGLPFIPGSSLAPELAILEVARKNGKIELSWPAAALTHVLEYANDPAGPWTLVLEGIAEREGRNHFSAPLGMPPKRFWRLRKL